MHAGSVRALRIQHADSAVLDLHGVDPSIIFNLQRLIPRRAQIEAVQHGSILHDLHLRPVGSQQRSYAPGDSQQEDRGTNQDQYSLFTHVQLH